MLCGDPLSYGNYRITKYDHTYFQFDKSPLRVLLLGGLIPARQHFPANQDIPALLSRLVSATLPHRTSLGATGLVLPLNSQWQRNEVGASSGTKAAALPADFSNIVLEHHKDSVLK